jgi:hypothetical protein
MSELDAAFSAWDGERVQPDGRGTAQRVLVTADGEGFHVWRVASWEADGARRQVVFRCEQLVGSVKGLSGLPDLLRRSLAEPRGSPKLAGTEGGT